MGLKKNQDEEQGKRYLIKGVANPDTIQQELASACRNSFNVPINPKMSVYVLDGSPLIVAFIPEAFCRDKPVYIKSLGLEKGSFRRMGSADYCCTSDDLDWLYQLRRQRNYESEVLLSISWEDISEEAVETYRRLRAQLEPNAEELKLGDQELILSLGGAVKQNREITPTIGGLLLFGNKAALRRELPMAARVDYVIVEGIDWVEDPSTRYKFATEYREALVTLMPRLHAQIMSDIPSKFGLETGQLQRIDTPFIPRDVIREAVANALMHRDYRSHQPTQIIRYSNRLEFRNAGYSLKPIEEIGEPGSKQRNPMIAAVFHELKHAETKGTGIRSMRKWMQEAGLTTPPIIESNREGNGFNLILLPHHLLDHQTLKWLSQFRDIELSDAQRRALAFTREIGAITNQDYRQLNGLDTLTASLSLRKLRDVGLLAQKGKGNGTYYILASKAVPLSEDLSNESYTTVLSGSGASYTTVLSGEVTPHTTALSGEVTPHTTVLSGRINSLIGSSNKGLRAIPVRFPRLSDELKQQISTLGRRSKKIKPLIKALCALGSLQLVELADILNRDPKHLSAYYLAEMIKSGELIYEYPNQPAHPQQAYKTPNKDRI